MSEEQDLRLTTARLTVRDPEGKVKRFHFALYSINTAERVRRRKVTIMANEAVASLSEAWGIDIRKPIVNISDIRLWDFDVMQER